MIRLKKILIIIARGDFRDEEYFVPKDIFEKQGLKVKTASETLGIAYGKLGGETEVDILLENVRVSDFEAIILAGGPGAKNYFENPLVHRIVREATEKNIILGAICIAPVILAKSGILKNKKSTVWTSLVDKSTARHLEEGGAIYLDEDVVSDGNIITACGPEAAKKFARAIITKLGV